MLIQVFSEYSRIAKAGRAKALTCPMHEDPIYPLYPYLTEKETIVLECYACSYKHSVGQSMYNQVLDIIKNDPIEGLLSEPEKKEPPYNHIAPDEVAEMLQ